MGRKLGRLLILVGVVVLLVAAGQLGYDQWRRFQMRQQVAALRQTPLVVPSPTRPAPTASPSATATARPSPSATVQMPGPSGTATTHAPQPSPTVPSTPTFTPERVRPATRRASATPAAATSPPAPTATRAAVLPTATTPATRPALPTSATPILPTATNTAPLPPSPARPVRMVVPAIGLDIPVVEVRWQVEERNGVRYSTWQTAAYAAGHHLGSANPGEPGNVVLSGHHNIEGEVFREISSIGEPGSSLGLGDEVILFAGDGRAFVYRIVAWHRFREVGAGAEDRQAHARFAGPSDRAILTLVTCWPYVTNSHRTVVVAELVGPYTGG